MIDFNSLKCLNLYLLVNLVLYLLQNNFVNVRFQLNSIFFACLLLWLSLWRLVSSLFALFYMILSTFFFTLFPEIIIRLIFLAFSNLSVMIQAKGWKSLWNCLSYVVNIVIYWLGSALCLVSHSNKQSAVSDFLKVFLKLWTSCWLICIIKTQIYSIVYKQMILIFY